MDPLTKSKIEITRVPGMRVFHSITAPLGSYMCDIVFIRYSDSKVMRKANELDRVLVIDIEHEPIEPLREEQRLKRASKKSRTVIDPDEPPTGSGRSSRSAKARIAKTRSATCFLAVQEIPTRYVYTRALATKGSPDVCAAFRDIYKQIVDKEERPFIELTHDAGKEFDNEQWNALLRNELPHSIKFMDGAEFTQPVIRELVKEPTDRYSMALIDSFCRVFKRMLENHLIINESLDWVTALPIVTRKYNLHTMHVGVRNLVGLARVPRDPKSKKPTAHTVQASPQQLRDSADSPNPVLFNAAYENDRMRGSAGLKRLLSFKIGDKVRIRLRPDEQPRDISRISKPGKTIAKGAQRWSNKVYTIRAISGFSLELAQSDGKPSPRTYRQHDLIKVAPDSIDVPDIWERAAKEQRREKRRVHEDL